MISRGAGRLVLLFTAALVAAPAPAQEPEVIVLDPNHPLIQAPGSVPPPAGDGQAAPVPAAAAQGAPPASGVNVQEVLADLWFRQRALIGRGRAEEAAAQIEAALEFMQREGVRASPEIAGAFLAEGRRALDEGDYRWAKEHFGAAARFDPTLGAAHTGLSSALLWGDRDLAGAATELGRAIGIALGDPVTLHQEAGNGLLVVFLGLSLGAGLALVLLCARSVPAFFHDLQERFPGRLSEATAPVIGWGLLALPVIALLPLAWALAAWGALFFAYFRRSERGVALGALLLLVASGPAGRTMEWIFQSAADPGVRALLRSARGGYDPQDEKALGRLMIEHPREAIFPFLLASIYRISGRAEEAMKMSRRVLEINPGHARAMVNLGNLHALRQEFALAQDLYRRAAEADPALALAHYNSHLAHLEMFHLEAADAALRRARQIDDALVTDMVARGGAGRAKGSPRDAAYTSREIGERALLLRVREGPGREWVRALGAPASLAGGAGLLGALLLPGMGLVARAPARRCLRCGRSYCRRCQVASKYPDHCSQCLHLFILRDGVAPSVKNRKMEEVARFRRRVWISERLVSLALPGSGHVLGGRPILGALLLMAWSVAWIGLVLGGRLLVSPQWIAPADGPGYLVLPAGLAIMAWLLGNLSSHERNQEQ
jgi:tetratricopeptide (TPR) repeat protein